jgi:hypothetical protein
VFCWSQEANLNGRNLKADQWNPVKGTSSPAASRPDPPTRSPHIFRGCVRGEPHGKPISWDLGRRRLHQLISEDVVDVVGVSGVIGHGSRVVRQAPRVRSTIV